MRIYSTSDGNLLLWVTGAGQWRIDPVSGSTVAATRQPLLWSPDGAHRIVASVSGNVTTLSELGQDGSLRFDAYFGHGQPPGKDADSYRAYRFVWHGRPKDPPAVAVAGNTAYVSWNGATEVARWQVLVGNANDDLGVVASAAKTEFETPIRFRPAGKFVAIQALDRNGQVLGVSRTLKLKP